MKKTIFILLTTTIFLVVYAYTDPGSGMLLIQGIIELY